MLCSFYESGCKGYKSLFTQKKLFTELIASSIKMKRIEDIKNWFRNICIFLSSEIYDTKVKAAHFELFALCCGEETF